MEIILKDFVPNVGEPNDVVEVKRGYAVNYLIPQGKAIAATPSAKKQLEETLRQRAHKEARLRDAAQDLANKLSNIVLEIPMKAGETGRIFGSVNTIMLSEALKNSGFEVDRRRIDIPNPPSEVGKYEAVAKLYRDVVARFTFTVVAEK